MTKTQDPAPRAIGTGSSNDKEGSGHPPYSPTRQSSQELRLRFAVRAAIAAYEKSGRMLDAALAYAAHGFPIFPLDIKRKKPIPRRDKDPTGKFPKGIPGTGGFYKATTDALIIRAWWQKNPNALIGLPMGERTGVWTLDIDTSEDHADGVAEWNKIVAQHARTRRARESRRGDHHHLRTIPAYKTREHRSATDGPHLIFKWNAELPIGCSAGALPNGIEVKGQGGYIAVPPSRRKGRSYTVHNDIDPVDAPRWLLDLILQGRSPNRENNITSSIPVDHDDLVDAMQYVRNDNLSWDEWTKDGLALFAHCGNDNGFDLFDAHSQKSPKYDAAYTRQRWEEIKGSPPNRTGVGKLYKRACANGWVPKLRAAAPTHAIDGIDRTADAARNRTRQIIHDFLENTARRATGNVWIDYAAFVSKLLNLAIVWAMDVPTGVGKTQITIEELAKKIRTGAEGPVIYAVPRHKLGHKIEQQFAAHGINAKIFRGRGAIDPENPDKQMCLNPTAVELAMKCHADITATCCKNKKMKCQFFEQCGYQRQMPGTAPDIWIVAGDMLFHTQKVFGEPAAVIIDEAIWKKGIRGIEREQYGFEWAVAIDSLLSPELDVFDDLGLRNSDRNWLGETLQKQLRNGGVERQYFTSSIGIRGCNQSISREWKCLPRIVLQPGMSSAELKRLARDNDLIDAIAHSRRIIKIWEAVRELLANPEIAVSGRLTLKQKNGQRVIEWRGVAPISTQFLQPTLLLDATLPAQSILQIYHPQVEVVANIKVAMPPHVHIRQILQAPTSSNELDNEKHLDEVRRYILQRFIEIGRKRTLVICQEKFERWLQNKGLPAAIKLEHYNDVAGLDDYKDVRLLIMIGRTAPGPQAMEAMAAALSGAQPIIATPGANGFAWYQPIKRGIRLADGSGIATKGDLHPDPMVEAVRWLVHEGELMQAIGRARAINRTAETPLDIDLLFDSCLPITVDKVSVWKKPSLLIETAKDGVMPTAPTDMVRLWPKLWPHDKAADRTLKLGVPVLPGFLPVNYHPVGPKKKQRLAYFDPIIIPDPMTWLQERLGPLVRGSLMKLSL